jgi:3-deoxy-D-manno-octulosonic-acid transferase
MKVIYNIGIYLFSGLAWLISPFNLKVRLWITGRKNWFELLKKKIGSEERYVWIHCASLGEFEQGRPVIEALKKEKPHIKILLTFFSPSGYEVRKNYQMADIICYLPADTPGNAEKFIKLVDPAVVIFVKYEFWHNYLTILGNKKIPLYLISGIFRKDQHFFRWYGTFFRNMLEKFSWLFVQDQQSLELLGDISIKNVTVAGDTRFDRVMQAAGTARDIPQLQRFRGDEKLFLAGSSWKQDEEIITRYINKYPDRIKWIFAPHEIDSRNIERLAKLLKTKYIKFSEFTDADTDARVLIIDNIGMLSSAYRYACIAEIGGGFGKGIHNILEPACWSIPVLFGPNHRIFREAVELIGSGGAQTFSDYEGFEKIVEQWLSNKETYQKAAEAAGKYVRENTGATGKIMQGIVSKDTNRLCS